MNTLVARSKGQVLELSDYEMAVRSGDLYRKSARGEMAPFPKEAEIAFLPHRQPIAWNKKTCELEALEKDSETVSAILPIGYLRTLLPASSPVHQGPFLPQWAYTAIGVQKDRWMSASIQIDSSDRWNNRFYNTTELADLINEQLSKNKANRILNQLSHCAHDYHCYTAQNIFYKRWEGALPVSPVCNARCVGCISLQPAKGSKASHQRISFTPSLDEISEIALIHLEKAEDPIISFGQGCEGEPLTAGSLLEEAIKNIRAKTSRGTININTNGSLPEVFSKLCKAGLDALRLSLNSARKETYEAYYQPQGYSFEDMVRTAEVARRERLAVSLNLLTFPGVTDREEEIEALIRFIERTRPNAIQWRNLAMDPDQYLMSIPKRKGAILGIPYFLSLLKKKFPELKHLSFSRPKEFFHS